jgi:hypothetical protein
MAELHQSIVTRLQGDATLTGSGAAQLGFGVYDRWLTPGPGPGSTPSAFDQAAGGRLKRSIVVLDGGETRNPALGRQGTFIWDSAPVVYLFAEAHANGKAAVEAADRRVEALLLGWGLVLTSGERVTFARDSRVGLEDAQQFPGNVVTVVRYRATGARIVPDVSAWTVNP